MVTPLDRVSLAAIPSALPGKFYKGGPYELGDLLREPQEYGDEEIDWRPVQIANADNVPMRTAHIDVACSRHQTNASDSPAFATRVAYVLRYLYRDDVMSAIKGVVQLKISHKIHGLQRRFEVDCEKVIQTVYVAPGSRGRGIARVLLAEVLDDAPDVRVHPQFSDDGAKLFGFDKTGSRRSYNQV